MFPRSKIGNDSLPGFEVLRVNFGLDGLGILEVLVDTETFDVTT